MVLRCSESARIVDLVERGIQFQENRSEYRSNAPELVCAADAVCVAIVCGRHHPGEGHIAERMAACNLASDFCDCAVWNFYLLAGQANASELCDRDIQLSRARNTRL